MKLKEKLKTPNKVLSAELCLIPSALVTQAISAAGADAVIIDQEHGAIDITCLHSMVAATAGTTCAPLVRVPAIDSSYVKRALDMGAEGIVFPLIKSQSEARTCVSMTRYPPDGVRGWGPFIAQSRWQLPLMNYLPSIDTKIVCIILIETNEALENIEEICRIDGIDCIFLAKFDLSTALGIPGNFDHPKFKESVRRIEESVLKSGIPLGGGPANTESDAQELIARGYRVIAGFDLLRLKSSVEKSISWNRL